MTVSSPCTLGPLKRVIGEETGIGACSGKRDDRAADALADDRVGAGAAGGGDVGGLEFAGGADFGRPVVSTEPCLSNSKVSVSRIGGSSPETVESLPPP